MNFSALDEIPKEDVTPTKLPDHGGLASFPDDDATEESDFQGISTKFTPIVESTMGSINTQSSPLKSKLPSSTATLSRSSSQKESSPDVLRYSSQPGENSSNMDLSLSRPSVLPVSRGRRASLSAVSNHAQASSEPQNLLRKPSVNRLSDFRSPVRVTSTICPGKVTSKAEKPFKLMKEIVMDNLVPQTLNQWPDGESATSIHTTESNSVLREKSSPSATKEYAPSKYLLDNPLLKYVENNLVERTDRIIQGLGRPQPESTSNLADASPALGIDLGTPILKEESTDGADVPTRNNSMTIFSSLESIQAATEENLSKVLIEFRENLTAQDHPLDATMACLILKTLFQLESDLVIVMFLLLD